MSHLKHLTFQVYWFCFCGKQFSEVMNFETSKMIVMLWIKHDFIQWGFVSVKFIMLVYYRGWVKRRVILPNTTTVDNAKGSICNAEPTRLTITNPHLLSVAWNLAPVLPDNWRIYDWSDQKFTLNIPGKSH